MPSIRRNIRLTTIATMLALISITSVAFSKESEDGPFDNAPQEQQVPVHPSHTQSVDSFTMAIMGMSLGCMCVASSVHWTLSQRKRLAMNIQRLDNFLANNCAVQFHLAGSADNDPMLHMVKDLQTNQDTLLRDHADQHDEMVKKISTIEAEIMRIWG